MTFLEQNGIRLIDIEAHELADYVEEVTLHVHTEDDTAFWFAELSEN